MTPSERGPAPRRLLTGPILFYQRRISPLLGRRCRYHPTCSAYALQAIRAYGPARGLVLAAWRLLRCNPLSHGGYDPVSAQTLFRRPPRAPSAPASHS
jgi:putative membrane protein insertion efficiency factor